MTRLRLYADRTVLADNAPPCILLVPFWGLADADEAKDLPRIGERVQAACRQLWLDWLSPRGFFANLHRYVER